MRLETDYPALYARIDDAFEAAVGDTLDAHRAQAPRRTGRYAASLDATRSGLHASVGSRLPQAAALRFGANVGSRVGPHHGPVDTFDDGRVFLDRMGERLRR